MSRKHRNRSDRPEVAATKPAPIVRTEPRVGRNDACPCGCGRKYKKCMGSSRPAPPPSGYGNMQNIYTEDQRKAHKQFIRTWGFEPNPAQLMMFATGDPDEIKANVIKSMQIVAAQTDTDFSQYEYAIASCNRLLTPKNEDMWTIEEVEEWKAACDEFDEQKEVVESED